MSLIEKIYKSPNLNGIEEFSPVRLNLFNYSNSKEPLLKFTARSQAENTNEPLIYNTFSKIDGTFCTINTTKKSEKLLNNPWQVTGITDGDGNFSLSLINTKSRLLVVPKYVLAAAKSPENYEMLLNIKLFFGNIGFITTFKKRYAYNVVGLRNGLKIKHHFQIYPLMTYKLVYFNLGEKVLEIIERGDHLTDEGLKNIIEIKAAFKKGINSKLLDLYPNITPVPTPDYVPHLNLLNEEWLSGFINTDGSFSLSKYKTCAQRANRSLEFNIVPQIRIYQDDLSLKVLESIQKLLGTGKIIRPSSGRNVSTLAFTSKSSILSLINILNKYPLQGVKFLDYLDFCKGYELYLKKEHLNPDGLKKFLSIAEGMNNGRNFK